MAGLQSPGTGPAAGAPEMQASQAKFAYTDSRLATILSSSPWPFAHRRSRPTELDRIVFEPHEGGCMSSRHNGSDAAVLGIGPRVPCEY